MNKYITLRNDEIQKREIIEHTDPDGFLCGNVVINQIPHSGLICLQIDEIAACTSDGFLQRNVEVYAGVLLFLLLCGVSGVLHTRSEFSTSTNKAGCELIQLLSRTCKCLVCILIHTVLSAEIVNIIQFFPRWLHALAQLVQRIQRFLKVLLCFVCAIFEQPLNIFRVKRLKCTTGVLVHSAGEIAKQLLIIDNVAEILGLIIQTIHTADCLKQAVIVHRLVNVEISAGRCVESGQEFVHHDEQLHVRGFFNKLPLGLCFKLFYLFCNTALILRGIDADHTQIGGIFFERFRILVIADGVCAQITSLRHIRGYYRTLAESLALEDLEILARGVYRPGNQNSIACSIHQTRLGFKVKNDVICDFLQPGARGKNLLQIAPVRFQTSFCTRHQSDGFCLKPSVNAFLGSDVLRDISRLIAQIQNDTVSDALIELIGMDITAEDLQTGLFVLLKERRTGKADEERVGNNRLHCLVELAGLCAMALVHKHRNVAFC